MSKIAKTSTKKQKETKKTMFAIHVKNKHVISFKK